MRNLLISFIFLLAVPFLFSCKTAPEPEDLLPPKAFADRDSKFIRLEGVDIHYKQWGKGDIDLLMLHGMLSHTDSWSLTAPELGRNYNVTAFDRPAFGLTERPEVTEEFNPYTPEAAEQLTMALIEALKLEKPVLVGHSAGGNLALRLAISHPDSFSALILISPGVYTQIPPTMIREMMKMGMFEQFGMDVIRSIPDQITRLLARNYYRPELISGDMIYRYLRPTKIVNWDYALFEFLTAQHDSILNENLETIEIPVLIIQGVKDQVVPPRDNLRVSGIIPDTLLVFLENCGHAAHEEKPDDVIRLIEDFLENH